MECDRCPLMEINDIFSYVGVYPNLHQRIRHICKALNYFWKPNPIDTKKVEEKNAEIYVQ